MDKHVTILGVLYIVFSAFGLLGAFIVFVTLTGSGLLSGDSDAFFITTGIGTAVAGFLVLISIPGLLGGYGLLKHKSWGRILGLIFGALNLLNIPFGTILGIYSFWVLLKEETMSLFTASSTA